MMSFAVNCLWTFLIGAGVLAVTTGRRQIRELRSVKTSTDEIPMKVLITTRSWTPSPEGFDLAWQGARGNRRWSLADVTNERNTRANDDAWWRDWKTFRRRSSFETNGDNSKSRPLLDLTERSDLIPTLTPYEILHIGTPQTGESTSLGILENTDAPYLPHFDDYLLRDVIIDDNHRTSKIEHESVRNRTNVQIRDHQFKPPQEHNPFDIQSNEGLSTLGRQLMLGIQKSLQQDVNNRSSQSNSNLIGITGVSENEEYSERELDVRVIKDQKGEAIQEVKSNITNEVSPNVIEPKVNYVVPEIGYVEPEVHYVIPEFKYVLLKEPYAFLENETPIQNEEHNASKVQYVIPEVEYLRLNDSYTGSSFHINLSNMAQDNFTEEEPHQHTESILRNPKSIVFNEDNVDLQKEKSSSRRLVQRNTPRNLGARSENIVKMSRRVDTGNSAELISGSSEDSIPGTPDQDYPTLDYAPETGFSCAQQLQPGYYGDVETRCQVFHVCHADGRRDTFLCPVGTVFNQQYLVCDWWYNVDCNDTPKYYGLVSHQDRDFTIGASNVGSNGYIVDFSSGTSENVFGANKASDQSIDDSLGEVKFDDDNFGDSGNTDNVYDKSEFDYASHIENYNSGEQEKEEKVNESEGNSQSSENVRQEDSEKYFGGSKPYVLLKYESARAESSVPDKREYNRNLLDEAAYKSNFDKGLSNFKSAIIANHLRSTLGKKHPQAIKYVNFNNQNETKVGNAGYTPAFELAPSKLNHRARNHEWWQQPLYKTTNFKRDETSGLKTNADGDIIKISEGQLKKYIQEEPHTDLQISLRKAHQGTRNSYFTESSKAIFSEQTDAEPNKYNEKILVGQKPIFIQQHQQPVTLNKKVVQNNETTAITHAYDENEGNFYPQDDIHSRVVTFKSQNIPNNVKEDHQLRESLPRKVKVGNGSFKTKAKVSKNSTAFAIPMANYKSLRIKVYKPTTTQSPPTKLNPIYTEPKPKRKELKTSVSTISPETDGKPLLHSDHKVEELDYDAVKELNANYSSFNRPNSTYIVQNNVVSIEAHNENTTTLNLTLPPEQHQSVAQKKVKWGQRLTIRKVPHLSDLKSKFSKDLINKDKSKPTELQEQSSVNQPLRSISNKQQLAVKKTVQNVTRTKHINRNGKFGNSKSNKSHNPLTDRNSGSQANKKNQEGVKEAVEIRLGKITISAGDDKNRKKLNTTKIPISEGTHRSSFFNQRGSKPIHSPQRTYKIIQNTTGSNSKQGNATVDGRAIISSNFTVSVRVVADTIPLTLSIREKNKISQQKTSITSLSGNNVKRKEKEKNSVEQVQTQNSSNLKPEIFHHQSKLEKSPEVVDLLVDNSNLKVVAASNVSGIPDNINNTKITVRHGGYVVITTVKIGNKTISQKKTSVDSGNNDERSFNNSIVTTHNPLDLNKSLYYVPKEISSSNKTYPHLKLDVPVELNNFTHSQKMNSTKKPAVNLYYINKN